MPARAESDPQLVGGVILAAGEGKRFGSQKLLARVAGRPMVQHVIDAANASRLADVVVVVGADGERVGGLEMGRARVVTNPDYASGQAGSLKVGLRALGDGVAAAVVLLGDVPGVTAGLIDEVLFAHRQTGASIVLCKTQGHRSPPCLLHRSLWSEAFALSGDTGMRHLHAGRTDVVEIEVTEILADLDDIDTREDHERVAAHGKSAFGSAEKP